MNARDQGQPVIERETVQGKSLLPIHLAVADYDRTKPLIDGRVKPAGVDLSVDPKWIGDFCVRPVYEQYDIAEFSLSWYVAARMRGEPVIAMPLFPLRMPVLAYLYVRDEYPEIRLMLAEEITKVEQAGLMPHTKVHLRRGAGAYICGEESAMIESIEGKRGLPRHRPPYLVQVGLFGRPTLEQNVETLYWIRDLIERGPDWFIKQGRRDKKGFRSYSVSGRVKNPGVKQAPAGVTINELINEFSGGMLDGHTLKGFLPGGASGGIFAPNLADLPLDFGTFEPHGGFVGSHAVVILSDKDDMKAVALNLLKFFEDESCGQCTPCRAGTEKAVKLMAQGPWNVELLNELATLMRDASICGLGQAAPNPLLSVLKYFPEELTKPLWTW